MSKKGNEARQRFISALGLTQSDPKEVIGLIRDCMGHHRLAECECNGCTREKFPSESWESYDKARSEQQAWIEKRTALVEARIAKRCAKLGLFATFQGDPRGCTCKFQREPFSKDQWGHADTANAIGADVWNWK